METLLIVDDNPINLEVMCHLFRPQYAVRAVASGERALQAVHESPIPDLVLLDLMLTGMDGFEVLRQLKADSRTMAIPVIIVTASHDGRAEERGLTLGAADFLTKPLRPRTALARVRAHLDARNARAALQERNAHLEAEVRRRMHENSLIQDASILALARLAETRDPETGNHIRRTQGYVRVLCEALRDRPGWAGYLDEQRVELLVKSAPLHDIGKVGIPDHILLKPGALTPEEWAIMKTHSRIGAEAIEHAEQDVAQPLPFLEMAKQIALYHHEKWDGSGYPMGLRGPDIPYPARLMALADVFDALISSRPYKEPHPAEAAIEIIRQGRGRHFDPDVVDAFLRTQDQFVRIAADHADAPEDLEAHLQRLRPPQLQSVATTRPLPAPAPAPHSARVTAW
jgi:putative two-component system response regulator